MARIVRWCITDYELDMAFYETNMANGLIRDIIIGEEVCPTTGKIHWQVAVQFKAVRGKNISAARKWAAPRHIEAMEKPWAASVAYCSKDNKVLLKVEADRKEQKPGKRTDIETVKEMVKAGASYQEIYDTTTSWQALRMAQVGLTFYGRKRSWKPHVSWFWGKSGTGKTRSAAELLPDAWMSHGDLQWWDGYEGHEDVILDDFRPDDIRLNKLLRILDRYPMRVMVKGGSRELLAKRIIITSILSPHDCYWRGEDPQQLLRRIDVIKEYIATPIEVGSVILEETQPPSPDSPREAPGSRLANVGVSEFDLEALINSLPSGN